ncbi:MAG: HAMP domain-containing protein [Chloroflexi bacterium]|nr:HAMP domain-containing protein [Chloroflexota bacterium]
MKQGSFRWWRHLGLARKIVVLAFAGSAVAVSSFAILAMWSLDQSTQRTLQERKLMAIAAAESIDHYNEIVLDQLERLGDSLAPSLAGKAPAGGPVLSTGDAVLGFRFQNLMLADASGIVVEAYPGPSPVAGSHISDYGESGIVLTSAENYISGTVQSSATPSIIYAVPLIVEGRTVGILAAEINLKSSGIGGFIQTIRLGQTGYAQVVDAKGALLASTQPEQVFGTSDHGFRFVALIEDRKPVVRTCHNCHETEAAGAPVRRKDLLAFAPLETARWGVAVRQAEDEAMEQTKKLQQGILIVGAIALGIAFPGTIAIASRAVRPLLSLTEASKRMAGGDLQTAIPGMGEDEVGVLADNLEQMRRSLAELYAEVRRKEELRGQLLEKVISAQEEERKRIARELHDEPAQIFSALVMQLDAMGNELPASEGPAKERLHRLQGLASNALETVRKIMSDLRPTALDDLGLIPAIRQYAEGKLGPAGIKVNMRSLNMGMRLPGHIETAVFRVLQEAVNNVYKHSHAGKVSIHVSIRHDKLAAVVSDDGKGFERADRGKAGQGLGLLGIQERVGLLGGTLAIKSDKGKGTELRIEVPLPKGEKGD